MVNALSLDTATEPVLTWVTTCKGRLAHLQQSLSRMVGQGSWAPAVQCVVVDYDCPQNTAKWVLQNHPQVRVVQAPGAGHFHAARARNLGAQHVTTPWIGFVDCDVLLASDFFDGIRPMLQDKAMLLANEQINELAGFVVCPTAAFHAAEAYDETIEGWGTEDRDLRQRLQQLGCSPVTVPAALLGYISHDDADRTRHHELADRFLSMRVNNLYLQAKMDLARQMGVLQIGGADRRNLYRQIKGIVLADPSAPAHLEIALPTGSDIARLPGWSLARRWVYSMVPDKPG
jgi:hypothetical protein